MPLSSKSQLPRRATAKVDEIRRIARSAVDEEALNALSETLGHIERMLAQLRALPGQEGEYAAFRARHDGVLLVVTDVDRAGTAARTLQQDLTRHLAPREGTGAFESRERDTALRALEFEARYAHLEPVTAAWVNAIFALPWLESESKTAEKAHHAAHALKSAHETARGHGATADWESGVAALDDAGRALAKFKAARKAHEAVVRKRAAERGDQSPFAMAKRIGGLLAGADSLSVPEVAAFRAEISSHIGSARVATDTALDAAYRGLVELETTVRGTILSAADRWATLDARWSAIQPQIRAVCATGGTETAPLSADVVGWRETRDARDADGATTALHALEAHLTTEPFASILVAHRRWVARGRAAAQKAHGAFVELGQNQAAAYLGPIVQGDHDYRTWCRLLHRAAALEGFTYSTAMTLVSAARPAHDAYAEARTAWLALEAYRAAQDVDFQREVDTAAGVVNRLRKNIQNLARVDHPTAAVATMKTLLPHWTLPEDITHAKENWKNGLPRQDSRSGVDALFDTEARVLTRVVADARALLADQRAVLALYESLSVDARRSDLRSRLTTPRSELTLARSTLDRVFARRTERDRNTPLGRSQGDLLAMIDAHAVEMDGLEAQISGTDLDAAEVAVDAAIEEARRRVQAAQAAAVDPAYALTPEALEAAAALRRTLTTKATEISQKFDSLQVYAKKKKDWLGSTKSVRSRLVDWTVRRIEELATLKRQLAGTEDIDTMQRIRDRLRQLATETQGGRAKIDALRAPDTTSLRARITTDLALLSTDPAIQTHRPGARDRLTHALREHLAQIGAVPSHILESVYLPKHERVLRLCRDAGMDANILAQFDREDAALAATLATPAFGTLAKTYPSVASAFEQRRAAARERTTHEGRLAAAFADLQQLHRELSGSLEDGPNQRARLELAESLTHRAGIEGAQTAFTELQTSLESRYTSLQSAHPTATALPTARSQLDRAGRAGTSGHFDTGLALLEIARERLHYAEAHPHGHVASALAALPVALERWQQTARAYRVGLTQLEAELTQLGVSAGMGDAIGGSLTALRARIPVDGFDRDVRMILDSHHPTERHAARERALTCLRDVQTHLFSDVRVRLLAGSPMQTDIPLEPMNRSLAELERSLLRCLPEAR